jgi:sigma-B regulation protein RsbU (phosphoserine phosphatase)
MYTLTGTVAGRFVQLPLGQGCHRIGRGAKNEIDLSHSSVSREHAEIRIESDQVFLKDLGSSNGTWVNENRVEDEVEIRPKDRLRFGAQTLVLITAQFKAPPEPSPVSVLHSTVLALSEHDSIHTQERISSEEVTGGARRHEAIDPMLFQAITESGNLLMLPRPLEETFDLLLTMVERVIRARRILLLLTDTPDRQPAIRAARPPVDEAAEERTLLSQTILNTVLQERQALLLNDAQDDPRFRAQQSVIMQNVRSAMVAPLFDNKEVIGLLYADHDAAGVVFSRNQLRAFTLLANLIAVKVTNARLLESQREKERMEQEVAAAARVQKKILPGALPTMPGYEILARQIPCFEVAGDLYDAVQLPDGRVALVVGDVTGKGMPAAMLMSNVMAALSILYQDFPPLEILAERLHLQVLGSSDELHFVTMFLGLLDPKKHTLDYVNAGHNPPLLLQHQAGGCKIEALGSTGLPLGLVADTSFRVETTNIPDDSLLCVFSDGIPEAIVGEEFYGEERFVQSVWDRCGQSLQEMADGAIDDLKKFLGEALLNDDVTLLMVRRLPQGDSPA